MVGFFRKVVDKKGDTQKLSFASKFGYVTPLERAVLESNVKAVKAQLDNNASIVRTTPSGKRLDVRLIAENMARANPSNDSCREIDKLLNPPKITTVPRPGMR